MRLTAEEVARTHTEVFNASLLSGDLDTLAMLYADDYMLVRPDGSVLSKDEVLYGLREGGLTFKSIEVTNVKVRVYGTAALLTAESLMTASKLGQQARAHIRLLAVYVADGNGLRLAHFQSLLLPT
jgi:ketosteroid isomerase-like protein